MPVNTIQTRDSFILKPLDDTLHIRNSSHGIKEPSRVFERFYKESERGLGIGLHIVKALSEQLHIRTHLTVEKKTVEVTLQLSQVTLN